jgi:hypothetical protein
VAWDEWGRAARDRARSDGWAPEAEDKEEPDFPSEPATSARAITL